MARFTHIRNSDTSVVFDGWYTSGELSIEQGVAYYQIPLNLPNGIGGIQPALALSYSSAGTLRSALGAGFTLSGLSSISRCGDVPYIDGDYNTVTLTETDNYCLDGNRLVAVDGTIGKDQSIYTTYINTQAKLTLSVIQPAAIAILSYKRKTVHPSVTITMSCHNLGCLRQS